MTDNFEDSFKVYVDQVKPDNDPNAIDAFYKDVFNLKEDIKHMENLFNRLEEINDAIKSAIDAKTMMEFRARAQMNMDHVLKLAKLISKKFDGLVHTNAAQRRIQGSGPGSANDQARSSMMGEIGDSLKNIMRKSQALRNKIETGHKQAIETRYFSIMGEKVTEEAIENFLTCDLNGGALNQAIEQHGRGAVLDAMTEIEERRDAVKQDRKILMSFYQILLGIASPIDVQVKVAGGGLHSPVENVAPTQPTAITALFGGKVGIGKLNDYEKETRNQAYIALVIALALSIGIITMYLKHEAQELKEQ